jgi:hypothetical protein
VLGETSSAQEKRVDPHRLGIVSLTQELGRANIPGRK